MLQQEENKMIKTIRDINQAYTEIEGAKEEAAQGLIAEFPVVTGINMYPDNIDLSSENYTCGLYYNKYNIASDIEIRKSCGISGTMPETEEEAVKMFRTIKVEGEEFRKAALAIYDIYMPTPLVAENNE